MEVHKRGTKVLVLATSNPYAECIVGKVARVAAQEGGRGNPTDSYLVRCGDGFYAGFTFAQLQAVATKEN